MKTKQGKIKFLENFTAICEMFDKNYSDVLLEMYYESLKNFSIDQVVSGIKKSIITSKFFPKPVDIIIAITGGELKVEDKAHIEATKVLQAIKLHGAYKSVCFDNATTQAVIFQNFGGWVKMCSDLQSDQESWFIKDFIKAYRAFSISNMEHKGHLSGIHEIQNNSEGQKNDEQIEYIGDKSKAKHVEHIEKPKQIDNKLSELTDNIG